MSNRISSGGGILPGQIGHAAELFEDYWYAIGFLWSQEFNQLLFVFSILKTFCGKLFLGKMEGLLLFLFLHLFHADVFKNGGNERLVLLRRGNLAGSQSDHSLGDDVVNVNSDVLEHHMGNESIL